MNFEEQDRRSSAAIDRVHAGPVEWRPKRSERRNRPTGSATSRVDDPDRPARGTDQSADPFLAIVTWRTGVIDPGTNANEQGALPMNDVMVDIDRNRFTNAEGKTYWPKEGDIFVIPSRFDPSKRVSVQLHRDAVDDGSMRVQCYCGVAE